MPAKDAHSENIQNTNFAKKGEIKSNLFNFKSTLLDQPAYGRTGEKTQVSSIEQTFILVLPLIPKNKRDSNSKISNIGHGNKKASITRHEVSDSLQHSFRFQHMLETVRKNNVVKLCTEDRSIHGFDITKECFM